MATESFLMDLPQMIDLAIGTPEIGAVNYNILHAVLQIIVNQLNVGSYRVEFSGPTQAVVENMLKTVLSDEGRLQLTEYDVNGNTRTLKPKEVSNEVNTVVVVQRGILDDHKSLAANVEDDYQVVLDDDQISATKSKGSEDIANEEEAEPIIESPKTSLSPSLKSSKLDGSKDKSHQSVGTVKSLTDMNEETILSSTVSATQSPKDNTSKKSFVDDKNQSQRSPTSTKTQSASSSAADISKASSISMQIKSDATQTPPHLSVTEENCHISDIDELRRHFCRLKVQQMQLIRHLQCSKILAEDFQNKASLPIDSLCKESLSSPKIDEILGKIAPLEAKVQELEIQNCALHKSVYGNEKKLLTLEKSTTSLKLLDEQADEMSSKFQHALDTTNAVVADLVVHKVNTTQTLETYGDSLSELFRSKVGSDEFYELMLEKADNNLLNQKVSSEQFEAFKCEVNCKTKNIQDLLTGKDVEIQKALKEVDSAMAENLAKVDLESVKSHFTKICDFIQKQIDELSEECQRAPEAAGGSRSKYLKDVCCISCANNVVMKLEEECKLPKARKMQAPKPKNGKAYFACELENARHEMKQLGARNMNHYTTIMRTNQKPDHLCSRHCGGIHTIITPQDRALNRSRLGDRTNTGGPSYRQEYLVCGKNGSLFKGSATAVCCANIDCPTVCVKLENARHGTPESPKLEVRRNSAEKIETNPHQEHDTRTKITDLNRSEMEVTQVIPENLNVQDAAACQNNEDDNDLACVTPE